MSNYKKTLADVKPGGMVRLGDQVLSTSEGERRYVADFFATQLRRHDFGDYILTELAGDFACALAQHLSAQPSPGGQDAAIKAMAESLLCAESSATLEDAREQAALLLADALPHLVARQPVAEGYEVWAQNAENVAAELTDERAIKALRFAARGIRCAARQPVGEPVAWMHTHKATGRVEFGLSPMYDCDFNAVQWDSVALYAAPAQAVDLGQIWQQAFNDTAHSYRRNKSRMWVLQMLKERVQALIDSQAVGNG